MKQISKIGIFRRHLNHFKNLAELTFFLFFIAIISNVYAQEETKAASFGIHAGVNIGGSNIKTGPSFSLHGAYSLFGTSMQLELMLFYDSRPDAGVIERDNPSAVVETSAFGFAVGARTNIRPHKNWNPSLGLMQGFASVKEYDRLFKENFSPALCLLFSNTLYQKHMISIGMHAYLTKSQGVRNPHVGFIFNIKYGFWF